MLLCALNVNIPTKQFYLCPDFEYDPTCKMESVRCDVDEDYLKNEDNK